MPGIIIGAVILVYTGYVIIRKLNDMRNGKSCCGSCASCQAKGKCGSIK